jgi:translation initiation factor 1 (eIF-1/SUI1)
MAVTPEDLDTKTSTTLGNALGTDFKSIPLPDTKKLKTSAQYTDVLKEMLPEKVKGIEELGQAELTSQQLKASGEKRVKEKFAKTTRQDIELTEEQESGLEQPKFEPSQENALSLGSLFSLVATMGIMLGGSGKQSANNAMNAMTGMLKGWQTGRKDVYDKELKLYEKEMKRIELERKNLQTKLERLATLRVADRDAAFALENEIASQYPGIIASKVKNNTIDTVFQFVNSLNTTALAAEQKERELAIRAEIARMNKVKPIKEKDVIAIQGLSTFAEGLKDLQKRFKPEFANLGIKGYGAEQVLEAQRKGLPGFDKPIDRETVAWWGDYERLQAPNRHALFGATLTGNELKNYQSYTSKKSDNAQVVIDRLNDQIQFSNTEATKRIEALEDVGYRVPRININYQSTFAPSETTPQTGQNLTSEQIDQYRSQAKAGIAAGKSEEAVRQRFKRITGKEL